MHEWSCSSVRVHVDERLCETQNPTKSYESRFLWPLHKTKVRVDKTHSERNFVTKSSAPGNPSSVRSPWECLLMAFLSRTKNIRPMILHGGKRPTKSRCAFKRTPLISHQLRGDLHFEQQNTKSCRHATDSDKASGHARGSFVNNTRSFLTCCHTDFRLEFAH